MWTRADWVELEDPERYELIDGELVVKHRKSHPQVRAITILATWLRSCFGDMMVIHGAPTNLRPEDHPTNEPEPHLTVLIRSALEFSNFAEPEDLRLIVEVSIPTLEFDLTIKARLYARSGIVEYWVLDVDGRQLIVHREPVEGQYQSVVTFGEEERVATLAAPEREVRVGDLL